MEAVGDAEFRHAADDVVEHVAAAGHHEADVLEPFEHFGGGFDRRSYYRSTDSGTCRFDTVYQRETFTGRRRWSGNE